VSHFLKTRRPGEIALTIARPHWIVHKRALVLLACTVLFTAGAVACDPLDPVGEAALIAADVLGVLTIFSYPASALKRHEVKFTVSNQRILLETGLLARQVREFPLGGIDSVHIDQTIVGRLLGYGTVILNGSGGTRATVSHIADPFTLRGRMP
jgi:uncharacterized membrane protein YdbT with pleckstrin-like domain